MGRAEELFDRLVRGGEQAIDDMIADRTSEELYLDFKRSGNDGRAARTLHSDDRRNLGKALSGFGNSEGGVILWGVDCRNMDNNGDVARAKHPLGDARCFRSLLEGAVGAATVPAHSGARSEIVGEHFVATLVPKSNLAPHQVVPQQQYYMRAGSDFLPVPHAVLQGMFGRRPQPTVVHNWSLPAPEIRPMDHARFVSLRPEFLLFGQGPGLADDLFASVVVGSPSDRSRVQISAGSDDWPGTIAFEHRGSFVAKQTVRLAPGGHVKPFSLDIRLEPPFTRPFEYQILYGHSKSSTTELAFRVEPATLQEIVGAIVAAGTVADRERFYREILGVTHQITL